MTGSALRTPLRVEVPEDPDARLAFSGRRRAGGDDTGNVSLLVGGGAPAEARRRLADLVGVGAADLVFMEQVHGGRVETVGRADRGRGLADHADAVPGADGLVTTERGVALVVMVADCVPVLLVDPGRGVGVAHAGREGVAAGLVPATVSALAGGHASAVVAVVGPAIGGCCYEVPAALAEQVVAVAPEAAARTTWGTPALDLPAAVAGQLREAGVGRVERVGDCTRCAGDWFSHRGDPGAGRQGGVVVRAGAP